VLGHSTPYSSLVLGSLHSVSFKGHTRASTVTVSFKKVNFNIYLMTDSPEVNFQDPPGTGRP
jgi:hypothetical protein